MENKLRKHNNTHTCIPDSSHPTTGLAMHKDSQTISKTKPKIRIIQIFAPQIIKTDVENFRELVQRKTGKPSDGRKCCKNKKSTILAGTAGRDDQDSRRSNSGSGLIDGLSDDKPKSMNNSRERSSVKLEEEALCSDEISSSGYLGGFSDLEGFISELGGFPLDSNHVQGFEESQSHLL